MNTKDVAEMIVAIISILGVIYRIAQVERHIYEELKNLRFDLVSKIVETDTTLRIHLQDCSNRRESIDYRLHGIEDRLNHLSNRINERIKEIQRSLENKITVKAGRNDDE